MGAGVERGCDEVGVCEEEAFAEAFDARGTVDAEILSPSISSSSLYSSSFSPSSLSPSLLLIKKLSRLFEIDDLFKRSLMSRLLP